jgi:hypothetical protein
MGIHKGQLNYNERKQAEMTVENKEKLLLEDLVIDSEFADIIPPLAQLEFDQLQKNILEDQEVYHPIVVWGTTILDGHKRYEILKKNPQIPFRTRRLNFEDKYEAMSWICKNQIGRRNLSDAQLTILIGHRLEAEKMRRGGDRKSSKVKSKPQNEVLILGQNLTSQKIASEYGISKATVERAGEFVRALDIAREFDPNIERDIMAGEINPPKKDVIHIGKAPKEEVPELVAQLREQKKTSSKKSAGDSISTISARMAEDKPPATEKDMMVSLQAAVKTLIRTFETTFRYYPKMLEKAEHRSSLKRILNELIKYLNKIEGEST